MYTMACSRRPTTGSPTCSVRRGAGLPRGLPVSLSWRRLQAAPAAGDSIEAWARRERYAALADMARACGAALVLLAHHRRDQAETFLLQALRGAGPAGLAAMPREALRDGIVWARPWLEQPRHAIEAYVRRHRLSFVEDPSNADRSLARNRLRHAVWPALAAASITPSTSLAASARRAQEAAECLRELAALDAPQACAAAGPLGVAGLAGAVGRAARQPAARLAVRPGRGRRCPKRWCSGCCRNCRRATAGAAWPWPGGELRLHAGRCRPGAGRAGAEPRADLPQLDLSRAGRFAVPGWRGSFEVTCRALTAAWTPRSPAPLRVARTRRRRTVPAQPAVRCRAA